MTKAQKEDWNPGVGTIRILVEEYVPLSLRCASCIQLLQERPHMMDHTEFIPEFLLHVRRDTGNEPYVVSSGIVGQIVGFSSVVRRFASIESLTTELDKAGIGSDRYAIAMSSVDAEPGKTKSFAIDLNEAQKLSIVQTDSTE